MIVTKKPFKWVSAHRDIEFELTPATYTLFSTSGANGNIDGDTTFYYQTDGIYTPVIGDRFLITSGIYAGYHTITAISTSNIFGTIFQELTTETQFIGFQNAGDIILEIEPIQLGIYKGGGSLWFLYPFEYVASFNAEVNLDGKYVFNISGYVNKIFDVVNSNDSYTYGGLTFKNNLFNNVEVYANIGSANGVFISQHLVLNSAIDMYQLNRDYVDTGKNLNSLDTNFYFSCGLTENIQIVGDFVKVVGQYEDGILQTISSYFSPSDFNSDFVLIP